MRIRRGISWSVPRLRGRGEQGEIVRQTHFVPSFYTVLRRAAAAQPFARKSQTNHRPVVRLSFAYHGLASEARSTSTGAHPYRAAGNRIWNVLPWPSWLVIRSEPCCNSRTDRATAKPIPAPPVARD